MLRRTSLNAEKKGDYPNRRGGDVTEALVERVRQELTRYEHPLFDFEARAGAEGVAVLIRFKPDRAAVDEYSFELRPREIEHPQFPWTFQKHLYDCLHDYVIEMFIRTPQREN